MLALKPLLLKFTPLLILSLSLTSCADLTKTLTRSDVTATELKSTLFTPSDFPDYQIIQTSVANLSAENVIGEELNDKICDANSTLYSPLMVNEESTITLINAAEPVCLGKDEAKAATIENFSELLYVRENMLNASIAEQGGGVRNIKTKLLEYSAFGEDSLTYQTTAEITFEDNPIPYKSITVVLFSDQAAVSIILESYTESFPEDILTKAVTLSKSRLSLLK